VGNVMYVDDLLTHFKKDVLRYYVLHEIPFAQDGNMTYELVIERNNSDLANTMGNLVNRSIGMALKYREGKIKYQDATIEASLDLRNKALQALSVMKGNMDALKVADALEVIVDLARHANKYIDLTEPFKIFKDNNESILIDEILYHLIETSRFIGILLQAFIPDTANEILKQIQVSDQTFESLQTFGFLQTTQLEKPTVLFERFDLDKKLEEIIG
jgi:methionyl-tRNA synthetase